MNQRVLAIETSSLRGSVALWETRGTAGLAAPSETKAGSVSETEPEQGRLVGYARHEARNEHAERMLGLVEDALSQAGWCKTDLTRVAVGVGPGSFTGVRVALAIAQGITLGLGIPGVGVGSLRAVALGASNEDTRARVVVRDARRDEFFVARYAPDGTELTAPFVVLQSEAEGILRARFFAEESPEHGDNVLVGHRVGALPFAETDETCEPDARPVARWGAPLEASEHPIAPHYLRGPSLVRPELHKSPLDGPRK